MAAAATVAGGNGDGGGGGGDFGGGEGDGGRLRPLLRRHGRWHPNRHQHQRHRRRRTHRQQPLASTAAAWAGHLLLHLRPGYDYGYVLVRALKSEASIVYLSESVSVYAGRPGREVR